MIPPYPTPAWRYLWMAPYTDVFFFCIFVFCIFDKTLLISHDNCRGNFRTSNAVDAALALRCQKCIIIFIILIWGKNESVGQMKKIILLFSFLEKKGRSGPLNYSSNWCRLIDIFMYIVLLFWVDRYLLYYFW